MSKQFTKLIDSLNLSEFPINDTEEDTSPPTEEEVNIALQQANKLEEKFDSMVGFDQHDVEMDELADLAIQAHKDLQDLGMAVEVRHAGEIFSSSSQMLKIAVDAKNNKVEKKLKLLKLQLEKMRLDKTFNNDQNTLQGTVTSMDRTEIIKHLKQMQNESESDK